MNGSRSNYQQADWGIGRGAVQSAYLSNQMPAMYTGGTPPISVPSQDHYQPTAARMADLEFTIQRMRMEMENLYQTRQPAAPQPQIQPSPIYYPVPTHTPPPPPPPPQKVMGPEAIVLIGLIFLVIMAVILVQLINKSNDLVHKTTEMLYRSTELTTRLMYSQQWMFAQQHPRL